MDEIPHPFVDVSELGHGGVLGRAAGLTIAFAVAAAVLLWIGSRRSRD